MDMLSKHLCSGTWEDHPWDCYKMVLIFRWWSSFWHRDSLGNAGKRSVGKITQGGGLNFEVLTKWSATVILHHTSGDMGHAIYSFKTAIHLNDLTDFCRRGIEEKLQLPGYIFLLLLVGATKPMPLIALHTTI